MNALLIIIVVLGLARGFGKETELNDVVDAVIKLVGGPVVLVYDIYEGV